MESWVVGYEGDDDVERHAGSLTPGPSPLRGRGEKTRQASPLRIRVVSDYI